MDRRLALLLFSPDSGLSGASEAASIMGVLLGWDEARVDAELSGYRAYVMEHRVPAS
jgi:glycerol-3-phosphate dehydrogenase